MWKHIALGIVAGFWGSIGTLLLLAFIIGISKIPTKWIIRRNKKGCPECEEENEEKNYKNR